MNILFLATWYPHLYDVMDGLFVRKHARAVARVEGCVVDVLYICAHDDVIDEKFVDVEMAGVRELTLYCKPFAVSGDCYVGKLREIWLEWRRRRGVMPDMVHLNVISKFGWLARYLKWRYGVPYVVTEHWSGYLPENDSFRGLGRVLSARWVAAGASAIMPVSDRLMSAMKAKGLRNDNWLVVGNVVDDFFYSESGRKRKGKFRFLHVSCFDNASKNVLGIVDAIYFLSLRRTDFEVVMAGNGSDWAKCVDKADGLGLIERGLVSFPGLRTPREVKGDMDAADCFVLFSNYETAGVVLSEAAACGLPIISTKVGIAEKIVYRYGGLLVNAGDTDSLADAMRSMIDNAVTYDPNYIRSNSRKYSFDAVGRQFVEVYKQAIHKEL